MFGEPSFEQRKDALEQGKCTCFPENDEHGGCLKNCKHRKALIEKLSQQNELESEEVVEE